ncbi:Holin of 3TMs, for gene-transfer release [uncultured Caudovirales phage]|uniref:Holin of 3TMs, for gene-transfer release n=1 Tax=uncultured Caudovirales phage TaxID=2100421 RepID=A0A6J7WVH8_9CAUD|nr:Holin of 3TMs, for gene-transfer release [uncultured Caudovirales phage]
MDWFGVGGIIEAVGKVADDLITTDKEKIQLQLEGRKLDLEQMKIEQANNLAQVDVNKTEAASSNLFVSGWRPYIGWICGFALMYASILEPMARFAAKVGFGYAGVFPEIDTTLTMQVLFGLLGLAGMRTYEKTQGVAGK